MNTITPHAYISPTRNQLDTVLSVEEMKHIIQYYHPVNRQCNKMHLIRLTNDVISGRWNYNNGDSIKFDVNGNLIDGQHRILSHIGANKAFPTFVIMGLPPEAIGQIDMNLPRKFYQNEVIMECVNTQTRPTKKMWGGAKKRHSVAKEICRHSGMGNLSNAQIKQQMEKFAEELDFVLEYLPNKDAHRPGYLSALALYYRRCPDKATIFRNAVGGDGSFLPPGTILRLRKYLAIGSTGGNQIIDDHYITLRAIHCFHFDKQMLNISKKPMDWEF